LIETIRKLLIFWVLSFVAPAAKKEICLNSMELKKEIQLPFSFQSLYIMHYTPKEIKVGGEGSC